jgi:hypothetical protein
MKSNFENKVDVRGWVFNHSLANKVSKKGVEYIGGSINVATDKDAVNVVPVKFIYVPPTYKNGKPNATYNFLQQIIKENNTYEANGPSATKVRIDGDVACNDFVTREGEMASPKMIRGSFAHPETGDIAKVGCAKFKTDILIEGYQEVEVEGGDNYGRIRGYVFNYKNDFLPVEYTIHNNPGGMNYFEKADISVSEPLLTKVWGDIVCTTVENRTEIENAFGAPTVNVTTRTLRAWDIEGASVDPMDFGDEDYMTAADVTKGKAIREQHLAEVRADHDEYQNQRASAHNAFNNDNPPFDGGSVAKSASPTAAKNYKF